MVRNIKEIFRTYWHMKHDFPFLNTTDNEWDFYIYYYFYIYNYIVIIKALFDALR